MKLLIDEIEDLIEYFESKSNGITTAATLDDLADKLKTLGPSSVNDDDSDAEEDTDDSPKSKLIDSVEEEEIEEPAAAIAPITVHTKVAKSVKLADVSEVSEFYSKLVQLKNKIEALSKLEGADIEKIKVKASLAYENALGDLEEMADETFPKKLEAFGKQCQEKLIESLTTVINNGETLKKIYHFDAKKATFSRFVKIDETFLTYTYKVILRNVKDDEEFGYKDYVVAISQRVSPEEDEKPSFYITRLLKDSVEYNVGKEFTDAKGMVRLLHGILSFDHIRSNIDKIVIPFSDKELSEKFVHDHVASVQVDTKSHKIVVKLKSDATEEDAYALVPDFTDNLAEVINQKKIAVKYAIKLGSQIRIEFILVQKAKNKDMINSEQLADMKERYNLSDDAYRSLVKFFVVGN